MPHPDLFDKLMQETIKEYDENCIYFVIDETLGLLYRVNIHGGVEAALPRNLMVMANTLQVFIDEGGKAKWQYKNDTIGILWTTDMRWQVLSDIGVNKKLGFYSLSEFPQEVNDAQLLDSEGCEEN